MDIKKVYEDLDIIKDINSIFDDVFGDFKSYFTFKIIVNRDGGEVNNVEVTLTLDEGEFDSRFAEDERLVTTIDEIVRYVCAEHGYDDLEYVQLSVIEVGDEDDDSEDEDDGWSYDER